MKTTFILDVTNNRIVSSGTKVPPEKYADTVRSYIDTLAKNLGLTAVRFCELRGTPKFLIVEAVQEITLNVPKQTKILCNRKDLR
jgi:hypothetical protein